MNARYWLEQVHTLQIKQRIRILNVCGGHERTITMAGIRGSLPDNIELIPGPGCPVCVCPEEDLFTAIQLALHENVTIAAFGDMLRVPINVSRHEIRSLDMARAKDADVCTLASPQDALKLALKQPERRVIFFAVGFETTMAPIATMLMQRVPDNLLLLLAGRLTYPAVAKLLSVESPNFAAVIAPGHVATVMGAREWSFVVHQHKMPVAVAGFTSAHLLAAIYSVTRQIQEQQCFLDNCYAESVRDKGNITAQNFLRQIFTITDANWRGIGIIPNSGFTLAPQYQHLDARLIYPTYVDTARLRAGDMPPGCDCARVLLGKIYPNQCRLFGNTCEPRHPVGPCMVSNEGACRIWWSGNKQ